MAAIHFSFFSIGKFFRKNNRKKKEITAKTATSFPCNSLCRNPHVLIYFFLQVVSFSVGRSSAPVSSLSRCGCHGRRITLPKRILPWPYGLCRTLRTARAMAIACRIPFIAVSIPGGVCYQRPSVYSAEERVLAAFSCCMFSLAEKDWKIIRKRLDFDEKMRFVC
jgi:hypothetical protein